MNRTSLLLLVFCLAGASWLHGSEPMTFQELSLLVRSGVAPQEIVNDAARRKILQPLTAAQQQSLRDSGASPALVNALQTATLVASPEEAAAYRTRHTPVAPSVPAPGALPQALPEPAAAAAQLQPVFLSDRFTEGLEAAKTVPQQPVKASAAFSIDQLAEAKTQALRDRKPLGFIMMATTMLDKPTTTRETGGNAALLHFYEAFKNSLVLVFVPLETKKDLIPPAVLAGFSRPEIGGIAPNMTVVDATTNALIVAVPCGNAKTAGSDRDAFFKIAATAIQRWLTFHPMAIGVPTSEPAPAAK